MPAEARFLARALSGRPLDPGGVDEAALVRLAAAEGLGPWLSREMAARGLPVPASLARLRYAALARNLAIREALLALDRALGPGGPPVLVHKGTVLAFSVYPDPGLRPMEDADLLVRPGGRDALAGVLAGLGYAAEPRAPHLFVSGRVRLDVHADFLDAERVPARRLLAPRGMEPAWAAARPLGPEFSRLLAPAEADHVLALALHALKHSMSRLVWLLDLDLLLAGRDPGFYRDLARRAAFLSQEKPLSLAVWMAGAVFGRDHSGLSSLLPLPGTLETAILSLRARGRSMGLLGEILLASCIPGWQGRLSLFAGAAFPKHDPGPGGRSGAGNRVKRLLVSGGLAGREAARLALALLTQPRSGP